MDILELSKYTNSSPELKAVVEKLHNEVYRLSKNEAQAREILECLIDKPITKPEGFGAYSNAAYYKPKYAKFVAEQFDLMEQGKDRFVACKTKSMHVGRRTLKQIFSQGGQYLFKHLDPDGKYKTFRDDLMVKLHPGGVMLSWKTAVGIEVVGTNIPKGMHKDHVKWKGELDDFISTAEDGKKLLIEGLSLSEEHLEYVNGMCENTPGIFIKEISAVRIEVIKNLALWKRINSNEV